MEDFTPRPYQIDLYEKAAAQNSIIYLPTGSGKTYIAVMLIKKYSSQVQLPYSQGGKRMIFIVNTVPLVSQQSDYIARLTGLACKGYCGDMGVDYWSRKIWLDEIENSQVLVLVGDIFLNVLNQGYMTLDRVCLMIFDECHKAVGNHPMRNIMKCFERFDIKDHPRILGLTATLLNSNIKVESVDKTIHELEVTMHSRIVTVDSPKIVSEYEKLDEKFVRYAPPASYGIEKELGALMDYMIDVLSVVKLPGTFDCDLSSQELLPKPKHVRLKNLVEDAREHIETTGLYGGTKNLLLHIIQLETMKKSTDNLITLEILQFLITQMTKMRKIIDHRMGDVSELEKIFKFSSDHVLKTFEILKHFAATQEKLHCIIFVKRRATAYTLYHILKNLRRLSEEYSFLLPDYVVGYTNNPYKNPREGLCLSKWNKEVLLKFRSGRINCIVATDVVDEGVDVPSCGLIVRYDLPPDFRGYVQSKGRARNMLGNYVMLLPNEDNAYPQKYMNFQKIEGYMKQALIGHTDEREEVSQEEIHETLYKKEIEPYVVKKDGIESVLTDIAAISLINRYCASLMKSKFVFLTPTWTLHKLRNLEGKLLMKVSLRVPSISPLNREIEGDVMENLRLAKKSAALKACVELHKINELTDNLLPVEPSAILETTQALFPHWREEKSDQEHRAPGTTGKKRLHRIEHPRSLFSAFPVADKPLFLHLIRAKPSYPKPYESRQLAFYEFLNDDAGFALLTTKPLHQIPGFPIFMNVGELNVDIEVNHSTLVLSARKLAEVCFFHWIIFNTVLNLIKSFMVLDSENLSNSFLVVPTNKKGEICWTTIEKYKTVEELPPSEPINVLDYEFALIKPNYRSSSSVYVVTQVCEDLMAESAFPSGDFRSYMHYYKDRHGLNIRNPKQPMLEVKAISTKINCIRPRGIKPGLSKRKHADMLEEFEEHFVGELCSRTIFPAVYWLKASYLPSVLHRVCQLLVAEDLRRKIVTEACIGVLNLPPDSSWPPLVIQADKIEDNSEVSLDVSATEESVVNPVQAPIEIAGPEIDTLESNIYPWKKESEPANLYSDIERIQMIDIEYYHQFMNIPMDNDDKILRKQNSSHSFVKRPSVEAPRLNVLSKEDTNGPSPASIMQALTSKIAHDVFDLERLETLGDAFLKFGVCLYLFEAYPTCNEGQLTSIKGKMVGNRNLFYCGESKEIPGRMKVDTFEPMSNFIVPAFTVLRPLQQILLHSKTSPNVLYELTVPPTEQLSGVLSSTTYAKMEETILSWNETNSHTGMEPFLDVQSLSDKTVSDCVEALIGVYLSSMGVFGGFKMLMWFGILPASLEIDDMLHKVSGNPRLGDGNPDDHITQADYIENQIGYKFKDRAYLLQAFTHPSYTPNNITAAYERLEFLGDAILDFLITVHIYESCDYLSPGALTDLRSAIVNNITFACLAVKYGYHTALMAYAPNLQEIIERFVKFQADRNFTVDDELLWILLEEDDCKMAEYVDVPKILGDLFESVIGAIYLDTGKNLQKVWEIVYGLMETEIIAFSKQVPKQPIRVIYETPGANPRFSDSSVVEGTGSVMVTLEVIIAGKPKTFHGFGANKKLAKCAAAKQALKCIRSNV